MENIYVKNVRSLKDTGSVPLAPITLLVGENSSGKSTFLRMFPLIKQSIAKKTDGPILWAGDADDYVDFGSFKETITDGNEDHEMEIGFQFQTSLNSNLPYYYEDQSDRSDKSQIQFSITIKGQDEKEHVSTLILVIDQTQLEILFDEGVVKLDGEVVPDFDFPGKKKVQNAEEHFYWFYQRTDTSIFGYTLSSLFKLSVTYMLSLFDGSITPGAAANELIPFGKFLVKNVPLSKLETISGFQSYLNESPSKKKIQTLLKKILIAPDAEKKRFIIACKLFYFMSNYSRIEYYVDRYFRQVHYIAPLRATAERYYRLRNSAIDEVDYQGKNLAIFLNSLQQDQKRMAQFQEWTKENFGFMATVQKNPGHLSMAISRDGFATKINLSDTGFGYSQILPIITQLWELSTKKQSAQSSSMPLVVAIEQPELHLHPAMQGRLAKAFIACINLARENGYHLQLLLETHSKTMVDYFGRAVSRGALSTSDIAVVLFDRDEKTGHTKVTNTKYDPDGALDQWPIGFFEPEE